MSLIRCKYISGPHPCVKRPMARFLVVVARGLWARWDTKPSFTQKSSRIVAPDTRTHCSDAFLGSWWRPHVPVRLLRNTQFIGTGLQAWDWRPSRWLCCLCTWVQCELWCGGTWAGQMKSCSSNSKQCVTEGRRQEGQHYHRSLRQLVLPKSRAVIFALN